MPYFRVKKNTYRYKSNFENWGHCEKAGKNVLIIDTLLFEISKIFKAIKDGRKMLQTIHAYWESSNDILLENLNCKNIDINGRPINYDIFKYKKPRNRFLKTKIKEMYKPNIVDFIKLSKELSVYKKRFKYYVKNKLPSYEIDFDKAHFKYFSFHQSSYLIPKNSEMEIIRQYSKYLKLSQLKKDQELQVKIINFMDEFEHRFDMYVDKEVENINNFEYKLDEIFEYLVVIVNYFREHYIRTYNSIFRSYQIHAKKTPLYNKKVELFDFINFIRTFPDEPYESKCMPPNLNIPNFVSVEENIKHYYHPHLCQINMNFRIKNKLSNTENGHFS